MESRHTTVIRSPSPSTPILELIDTTLAELDTYDIDTTHLQEIAARLESHLQSATEALEMKDIDRAKDAVREIGDGIQEFIVSLRVVHAVDRRCLSPETSARIQAANQTLREFLDEMAGSL
jgi:glutamine synthetase type III